MQEWLLFGEESLGWEDLCRLAVPLLSHQMGNIIFGQASRYWHKNDSEWDILAESIDGKALFIGEAKWVSKLPSANWIHKTIEELKNKGLPPSVRQKYQQIVYGLFIPEKPKHLDTAPDIRIITAEEILSVLR